MADPQTALLVRFQAPGGRDVLVVPCPPDLRFSKDWPGGHKDMSCTVVLPAGSPAPAALTKMARVSVTDRRTAKVVWAGRLTDPGMSTTQDGPVTFAVTAEGHQSETDGWREVYAVIDRAQESWQAVGEFSPAQGSFSGDLTPGLDFELDPTDFGDLTDFGDDLAIDFDGNLDFGGDLGDFGNIDFGGVDYPSNADYPGYLGYLQDPDGAFGDMLPIPLGGLPDSGFLWVPGYNADSPSITVTGSSVQLGGTITRRPPDGSGSVTGSGGRMWPVASGDPDLHRYCGAITVRLRFLADDAAAMLVLWGTGDLMSGSVAIVRQSGMHSLHVVERGSIQPAFTQWTLDGLVVPPGTPWPPDPLPVGDEFTFTFSITGQFDGPPPYWQLVCAERYGWARGEFAGTGRELGYEGATVPAFASAFGHAAAARSYLGVGTVTESGPAKSVEFVEVTASMVNGIGGVVDEHPFI